MGHHQCSERGTQTEKKETIFTLGMLWIIHEETVLICKDTFRLLERHAVLPLILPVLLRIPFEPKIGHPLVLYRPRWANST